MTFGNRVWQSVMVVALGALVSTGALAQSVTTRLVNAGLATTSTKIVPGGSASMDVRLDIVTAQIFGTGFRLSQTAPVTSGFLSITARSFAGSPFNDTTSGDSDALVLAAASALLDPDNDNNLGRTTVGLVGIAPANNVLAVNLTLTAAAGTPLGTYTILPTAGVSFATDDAFNDYNMTTGTTPFTIIVGQTLTVTKSGSAPGVGTVTADSGAINCGATCSDIYPGTVVTLTATPNGTTFVGWSGAGCSGTGTCVVTVDAAKTVNAQFDGVVVQFPLDVSKDGTGTGTVTSAPAGINCGATCTASFNSGVSVTLTPTPTVGSVFAGWAGACSGTGACVVSMTQARSVTATFNLQQFALQVNKLGTGTGTVTSDVGGINCGATCNVSYNAGTVVTLTATPNTGVFAGWSGACTGTGTCVVTMDASKTVTATFAPTFSITVNKLGSGTGTVTGSPGAINCGATCTDTFAQGTVVTLTATPDAGMAFAGWSGGACSGTGTCVVTVNSAVTVTATFNAQFVLSVSKNGTGAGTVTSNVGGINCGGTCASTPLNSGTLVTLTATPAAGSAFVGWSGGGGCSGTGTCVVTLTAATTVTATFDLDVIPPDTFIDLGPSNPSNQANPTFFFSSSEPGSTFQCKLDAGSFQPCTSPHTVTVTNGPHTFSVFATDAAGNPDPTPAVFSWTAANVVNNAKPVPTLNEWMLMVLTLMLGGLGMTAYRRRIG